MTIRCFKKEAGVLEVYNYYYIKLDSGEFVYKTRACVKDEELARKFSTKIQADRYAKKYLDGKPYEIIGGGGIKEILPYEY